jgi:leucyl/phenylalanyl-tRNA--protein transferase
LSILCDKAVWKKAGSLFFRIFTQSLFFQSFWAIVFLFFAFTCMAYRLNQRELAFPAPHCADVNGLLAVGGDLSEARLRLAYAEGIFPWYSRFEPILWWSPDPRFVILPSNFKFAKSLRPHIRKQPYQVTVNRAFKSVIHNCKTRYRPGQQGTWITDEMEAAYLNLHQKGFAHSVEVWQGERLVGGLYGEILGKCFFGESMFALEPNASKIGFVVFVKNLLRYDWKLIDCQVYTEHLATFGATHISRKEFIQRLKKTQKEDTFEINALIRTFNQDPDFILS